MPVSVFLNTIFYWRAQYSFWYSRKFAGAGIEAHQERVQVVIDAIMAWKNSGMTTKLTTSRSVGGGVESRVLKCAEHVPFVLAEIFLLQLVFYVC